MSLEQCPLDRLAQAQQITPSPPHINLKRGGVMIWVFSAAPGPGHLGVIELPMNISVYQSILEPNVSPFSKKLKQVQKVLLLKVVNTKPLKNGVYLVT